MTGSQRVRERIGVPEVRNRGTVAFIGRLVGHLDCKVGVTIASTEVDLGRRVLAVAVGSSAGAWLAPAGRALIGAAAGAWVATHVLASADRRAADAAGAAIAAEMPFVLERIGSALRTGIAIDGAIKIVAPTTPGALGEALRDAARISELGGSRLDALDRLALAPSDDVKRAVRSLRRSDRLGVPAADAVDALASELRARARAAAETDARTAPVRMLFPLVFCFLPSSILLMIAPVAIQALRSLGGT